MRTEDQAANYINHITFVCDESSSMTHLARDFVRVMDAQVAHLAERSKFHDQETRVTVYLFSSHGTARCVIYDKDVLRMPSIREYYRPNGMTALIDTVLLSVADSRLIPQKYGEHAFLSFTLTDGLENNSRHRPSELAAAISSAPDNETYAALVPDQRALFEAKRCGFPAANIALWDATTSAGVEEAGSVIREATEQFMEGRKHGVRSYSAASGGLFRVRDFTKAEVASQLEPLKPGAYFFEDVDEAMPIREFVQNRTGSYQIGKAYYQLSKTEQIQPQKLIAVEMDGHVYAGPQARSLLGLPDYHVKVSPQHKPGTVVYVQSTSVNRKLVPGTKVLILR